MTFNSPKKTAKILFKTESPYYNIMVTTYNLPCIFLREYIQLATYFLDHYFQKLVLENKSFHLCLQGLAGLQFNSSQKA